MRHSYKVLLICVVVGAVAVVLAQNKPQIPEQARRIMALWEDQESWPRYEPGEITTRPRRFEPLRAVYDRQLGLDTDDPKKVKAIWEIDQVEWEGRPVTMISWYSFGDVAPRTSIGYVDPETFALLFREVTSPKKTTFTLVHSDRVIDHVVDAEGKLESEIVEKDHPVFDRWAVGHVVAGMELTEGMAMVLEGVYPGSKSLGEYPVRIGARRTIHDAKGEPHEVWPVMLPHGGPWMGYYFVDDRPPYLFGFENRNILTDEVGMRVTLVDYTPLP